jgi:hypothetical protein
VARRVVALLSRQAAAALPLVLFLLLTACGDGSDSVSTVTETTSVTETATVTETVTTTVTTRTETPTPDLATRSFQLPSGNIGCLLASGVLRCDILSGLDPEPTASCELDWVGLSIGRTRAAAPNCAGDTIFNPDMPTLAYGSSWSRKGITCESRRTGLRCSNRQGHELSLARGSWSVS